MSQLSTLIGLSMLGFMIFSYVSQDTRTQRMIASEERREEVVREIEPLIRNHLATKIVPSYTDYLKAINPPVAKPACFDHLTHYWGFQADRSEVAEYQIAVMDSPTLDPSATTFPLGGAVRAALSRCAAYPGSPPFKANLTNASRTSFCLKLTGGTQQRLDSPVFIEVSILYKEIARNLPVTCHHLRPVGPYTAPLGSPPYKLQALAYYTLMWGQRTTSGTLDEKTARGVLSVALN